MYDSKYGKSFHIESFTKLSLQKRSLYQNYLLSQNNEEENKFPAKKKSSKKKFISLTKVFKIPNNKLSPDKLWPKITKPKLPFSNRYTESNELIKKKIRLQKPSKSLRDFHTVKWMRNKYSDSVVEKSVLSLLPEKSKEIQMIFKGDMEKSKRYQEMIEYLKSLKGPVGREKFVEINPKYLFNESTFNKILKLREIFLEFDKKKTQKMDFDAILKMFNQNHIKADKKDIADLFFKGRKIERKEDIAKLNLGFFQFIHFALKKEQNFKEFMRKIREKNKHNEDKENVYLPMDFNLIMDYFINKEKERHSINKLKKAVDILNNDIRFNDPNENTSFNKKEKSDFSNRGKYKIRTKTTRTIKREKRILSDINITELFDEFINLFNFISKSEINIGTNNKYIQNKTTANSQNKTKYKKPLSLLYNTFNKNNNIEHKTKLSKTMNKTNYENDILKTLIKNQMNINVIKNLKLQNYNKLHDIDLAKEATLAQIKKGFDIKDHLILERIEKKKIPKKNVIERNSNILYTFSN